MTTRDIEATRKGQGRESRGHASAPAYRPTPPQHRQRLQPGLCTNPSAFGLMHKRKSIGNMVLIKGIGPFRRLQRYSACVIVATARTVDV